MPNKMLNEQYEIVYKIRKITFVASCSVGTKHIASRRAVKLIIQNSTPTYTKVTL
jgi:hypothetical protein